MDSILIHDNKTNKMIDTSTSNIYSTDFSKENIIYKYSPFEALKSKETHHHVQRECHNRMLFIFVLFGKGLGGDSFAKNC